MDSKTTSRRLAFFIATLSFLLAASAALAESFRIRGFVWGSSAENIKLSEKAGLKREAAQGAVKYLVYTDTFIGEPVSVVYRLIHDKLFEVTYQFEKNNRDCKDLRMKFDEVVADLTTKNGKPSPGTAENPVTCNVNKIWELGDTRLEAHLSADSGRVDLAVVARSKQLASLAEEVKTSPAPTAAP